MANKTVVNPEDELVQVYLFRDNDKYKDDVYVAVNGVGIYVPRGETVMIKRKYANVLEESQKGDAATAKMISQQSSEYSREVKRLQI